MEKEKKRIKGKVQDMTKDSVKIMNYWIKFFNTEKIKDIKEGDDVEVLYIDNTKNNRTYHNGESIIKYESFNIDKELTYDKLDTTTINTVLMCAKDMYVSENQLNIELAKQNKQLVNVDYQELVKEVIKGLNLI